MHHMMTNASNACLMLMAPCTPAALTARRLTFRLGFEFLQLVRDPEALARMAANLPNKAAAADEGPSNVIEAEFSEDA